MPNDPQDAEVAKHYLSDRASFNATAKHWAQAYAQAPVNKQPGAGGAGGKKVSDAEMAGLSEASVAQFTDMGFTREKVVSVFADSTHGVTARAVA